MNRKEFIGRVVNHMREGNARKPVATTSHTFQISDEEGNKRNFSVKASNKSVLYTVHDIDTVLKYVFETIKEILKEGEFVTFAGFGTFGLRYVRGRDVVDLDGKLHTIEDRYLPKFTYSNDLKRCAKLYKVSCDKLLNNPLPLYDDDDFDEDDYPEEGEL